MKARMTKRGKPQNSGAFSSPSKTAKPEPRQKPKVILLHKPYLTLSQFTDEGTGKETLAKYISHKNFYAAGRLDHDSEGLLVLSNFGPLQSWITDPRYKLTKTYWAQVEGTPSAEAIQKLQKGVVLNDGPTLPAEVKLIEAPDFPERNPPIRERKNIPTSWLEITIGEGRNRQVRRMTAAVGFPTLRLIRVRVGPWELGKMKPGQSKEVPCPETKAELQKWAELYFKIQKEKVQLPAQKEKTKPKSLNSVNYLDSEEWDELADSKD